MKWRNTRAVPSGLGIGGRVFLIAGLVVSGVVVFGLLSVLPGAIKQRLSGRAWTEMAQTASSAAATTGETNGTAEIVRATSDVVVRVEVAGLSDGLIGLQVLATLLASTLALTCAAVFAALCWRTLWGYPIGRWLAGAMIVVGAAFIVLGTGVEILTNGIPQWIAGELFGGGRGNGALHQTAGATYGGSALVGIVVAGVGTVLGIGARAQREIEGLV